MPEKYKFESWMKTRKVPFLTLRVLLRCNRDVCML